MSIQDEAVEKLNRAVDGYDADHAELIDIRIGADGTVYPSAGDAVRAQIESVGDNAIAAYVTDTATGAIASFSDGADGIPVKDLKVAIEPVQNLNGQPNPYPAGGGKNKTAMESATTSALGALNEATNGRIAELTAGQTYTLSFTILMAATGTQVNNRLGLYYDNNTTVDRWALNTTGRQSVTFTPTADCYINFWSGNNIYPANTKILDEIQLELGSTATAYAPYSNICPISGWSGAEVYVSPTTDAADGNTYPISWQTEAGTVYGGTLDVTTRVMTVTHKLISDWDNVTLSYSSATDSVYVIQIPFASNNFPTGVQYQAISNAFSTSIASGVPGRMVANTTIIYLALPKADMTEASVDGARAWLKSNSVTIVYELATPQTYQLTPIEVSTVLGQNNIWADCGNVDVEYRADTKLYINKMIANALNA